MSPSVGFCRAALLILILLVGTAPATAASVAAATTGSPSPLGLPFSTFGGVVVMADGRVAFLGSSTGVFRRVGDSIRHVAVAGGELPEGRVIAGVGAPARGSGDCVAVRAFLVGGGSRILRACGPATEVVAATGDPAPGGGTFAEFSPGVAYGAGGQIAFSAILDDGAAGLFLDDAGAKTSIARTAPGSASGQFVGLRLVGVTADGRVAFRGSVASGRDGLFMSRGDRPVRVVEVGEATPIGGTFRGIAGASVNAAGEVAFRADLSDGTRGVFRIDTGSPPRIALVTREGESIGGDAGRIRTLPSSLVPSINAAGTIAFRATLIGAAGGSAIFVADRTGSITRVVGARDSTVVGVLVRLRDPVVADDGSLVIPASVPAGGPSLFVSRAGALSALARIGDLTDADTGLERFRFSQPSARETAEEAVFSGSREGVFVASRDGALETVAFVGGPTPLGGTFAGFDPPAAEAPGLVVFGAEIKGSGRASRAIIARRGSRLRVVAKSKQRVRGGRLVDFFGTLDALGRADVGPKGEVAFEATLERGRSPRGLMHRRSGAPALVVGAQRPAPGGGRFETFGTPALLRGADMAFVAQLSGAQDRSLKLFLRKGGRTRAIAAQGGGAPGRLAGRFETIDPPDANEDLVAFRATLDQGGREGIYLTSGRGLGLLVGTGDPAPPGGAFRGVSAPALGARTVAFLGRLAGAPNTPGLYRVRADGVPAAEAAAPAIETVGVPGGASPLGGVIAEIGSFDVNRSDSLAVVVDLVGASSRSALLLVDPDGPIVP